MGTNYTALYDKKEFPEGEFPDRKPISDYLHITKTICLLPAVLTGALLSNVFAGSKRKPTKDVVLDTAMGHAYKSSTLRQLRILTMVKPLRAELRQFYYRLASSNLPNYNTVFEGEGFNARWISEIPDRTPEDPVLLYFHGGGYALKTCQPQVEYICQLAHALRPHRYSVLSLDYVITPFFQFPTQQTEAVNCVQALAAVCDRIVIIGDSCGGNLALTTLLHEEAMENIDIYGLVLVSPWVDLAAEGGSMDSQRDILSAERLNEMAINYTGRSNFSNPLVSPINADPAVWKRVLPENTIVVWGEDECLADQCADWASRAGITDLFIEPNGTHDCILRGMSPAPSQFITEKLLEWTSSDLALSTKISKSSIDTNRQSVHKSGNP